MSRNRSIYYVAGFLDGLCGTVDRVDTMNPIGPFTRLLLCIMPDGNMTLRAIRFVELRDTLHLIDNPNTRGEALDNAWKKADALESVMPECDVRKAISSRLRPVGWQRTR